jgi:hypothetical protein
MSVMHVAARLMMYCIYTFSEGRHDYAVEVKQDLMTRKHAMQDMRYVHDSTLDANINNVLLYKASKRALIRICAYNSIHLI